MVEWGFMPFGSSWPTHSAEILDAIRERGQETKAAERAHTVSILPVESSAQCSPKTTWCVVRASAAPVASA